ncbi:isoprenoid synthase domain-containing protein [Suillus placidus]|uniref:Terpene synthase n=1 Tax=Suillus placidus TaxID=48579 RepID=A0A9P7CZF8_9AGAM|nr:isoprenoid synthase domain-containing protein [Suillus placidus]
MSLITPTATYTAITHSDSESAGFILPDLFSDCHYPLRMNPHCHHVSRASEEWFFTEGHIVEPEITKFMGLRAGDLISGCYPDADAFHLRVCMDFLNWALKLDDDLLVVPDINVVWGIRECCMSAFRDPINTQTENVYGKMCKSFFTCFRETGGPRCTERFIRTMDLFFVAAAQEVDDRIKGRVFNLEYYISLRRDISGCKPFFAFIEYTAQIDLPDEVMLHPVIAAMEEATNDYVSWSNDILSYNVEQSCHSTHNLVAVLMCEQRMDLQDAVDYACQLCKGTIQRFEDNRAILPSWGEEVDKQVAIYVQGMQDWMTSSLHWHFTSTRYLGKDGPTVKQSRIIELLPKMPL